MALPAFRREVSACADIQVLSVDENSARLIALAPGKLDKTEVKWKRFVDSEWKQGQTKRLEANVLYALDPTKSRFEFKLNDLDPGMLYDVTVQLASDHWSRSHQFSTKAAPKELPPPDLKRDSSYITDAGNSPQKSPKRQKVDDEKYETVWNTNSRTPMKLGRATSAKKTDHLYTWDEIDAVMEKRLIPAKDFLGMEDHEAWLIMRYYDWNFNTLNARYWENSEKVKEECGIIDPVKPKYGPNEKFTDYVTMEEAYGRDCDHLACGHQMTKESWADLLQHAVKERGCTTHVCPEYKCQCIIPDQFWKKYTKPDEYQRYRKFVRKEFVSTCPELLECCAPKCGKLMEFPGGVPKEVRCASCSAECCPTCGGDAHRPASCSTFMRWNKTAGEEGATIRYLLEELKAALCPKCGFANERITGCNHMVCGQDTHGAKKGNFGCGTAFCYQCGDFWKQSGCNGYGCQRARIKNKGLEDQECFQIQKFYQQFTTNNDDVMDQQKKWPQVEERLNQLREAPYNLSGLQIETLKTAFNTVIKGRKRLAWTFAIAYYIPDKEARKNLFTDWQSMLQTYTNVLHQILNTQFMPLEKPYELELKSRDGFTGFTTEMNRQKYYRERTHRLPLMSAYDNHANAKKPPAKPGATAAAPAQVDEQEIKDLRRAEDDHFVLYVTGSETKDIYKADRIVKFTPNPKCTSELLKDFESMSLEQQYHVIRKVGSGAYPLKLSIKRWNGMAPHSDQLIHAVRDNTKKVETFLGNLMDSIEDGQGDDPALNDFFDHEGFFIIQGGDSKK